MMSEISDVNTSRKLRTGAPEGERESATGAVRAWEESVVLPTYAAGTPDRFPLFLERRVYQGSSGRVYPCPVTGSISAERREQSYRALFLENEYIKLMILPEIGGRIHGGLDKTNGYDFFYRQQVIKPALVGLLGPWISGGVEFNWPQHHRPSTFMPVQYWFEDEEDGSRTIWLSEHDPMERMKGMVGLRLSAGSALIEARVRLYNRTPFVQSFLWWVNVAVHVNDQYQAFFPPDVAGVADHAKRAISTYPIANGVYYGIDYRPGTDIRWWRNIPVPTSYMITNTRFDFMGGYDHDRQAGLVQGGNHHIAPGKKLWTWGNSDFGRAWERNLTDSDGPYVELMLGAYTDNQPDFSWLQPYETRCFSHYWYPIQQIGPAKNANREAAINLDCDADGVFVGVCTTKRRKIQILLSADGQMLFDTASEIEPGKPFLQRVAARPGVSEGTYLLRVLDENGDELIQYRPIAATVLAAATPATAPPPPAEVNSSEELYLIGAHLEQYRHATRSPEPYWEEALRRDPRDIRCNLALGRRLLRRGKPDEAAEHLQRSVARLTAYNPNPADGEAFYQLGLALRWKGQTEAAYAQFYKASWNAEWRSASCCALAEMAACGARISVAVEHLDEALRADSQNLKARNLKTALLRRVGRVEEARELVLATLQLDPLDLWSRHEARLLAVEPADLTIANRASLELLFGDRQACLDVAFDYSMAGLWEEAERLLQPFCVGDTAYPIALYAAAEFARRQGEAARACEYARRAAAVAGDYCFPSRLEEMRVLRTAIENAPGDAAAPYYLGNLLYDKGWHDDAARLWKQCVELDPTHAIAWRNLAIAAYHGNGDVVQGAAQARECCVRAFNAAPGEARLLEELDVVEKRLGTSPEARLHRLLDHPELVRQRDTLMLEQAALLNHLDRPEEALNLLASRRFYPWEGGEGGAALQYSAAHLRLGFGLLQGGDASGALAHFQSAGELPDNLGEARHPLTPNHHLDYLNALAREALGDTAQARALLEQVLRPATVPGAADYFRGLAFIRLGRAEESVACFEALRRQAAALRAMGPLPEFFATSVPDLCVFPEDLVRRHTAEAEYLTGLALCGLGEGTAARHCFEAALRIDPAHTPSAWALRQMGQAPQECVVPVTV